MLPAHKTLQEFNIGETCWRDPQNKLLVKLIDAANMLSIQVHPTIKDESWFILDAEPGSFIYNGFKNKYSNQEIKNAIRDNTFELLLNKMSVVPGQIFHISPGTVHAIGKGVLLLEAQDNVDATFRFYDFNRGRELHVDQALSCISDRESKPRHIFKVQPPAAAMAFFTSHRTPEILYVRTGGIRIKQEEEALDACAGCCIYLPPTNRLTCYHSFTLDTQVISITLNKE